MTSIARVERKAYAKVNLALAVGAPDAARDGMHPIASWMHAIDLADDVVIERHDGPPLAQHHVVWHDGSPVEWPAQDDLAVRAHLLLEREIGRPLPVRIEVIKRIPAGGGLGGGSADAAAVLMGLDELFGLGLGERRLQDMAWRLGSDIPFFIDAGEDGVGMGPPRPALVMEFGDRIERLAPAEAELLLACPPFGCATGRVYGAFDEAGPGQLAMGAVRGLALARPIEAGALFNDLASAAEAVEPALGEVRRQLATAVGLPVHVSGSGSTLFVLGPGGELVERAAEALPELAFISARLV